MDNVNLKKYLPIGSVCTLKGKNKKIMITGYYSVEFNGNLKIKDYIGCVYPEGMLLPNQTLTFNHTDIEKIDFVGFENEELNKFMTILNNLTGNVSDAEKAKDFHKQNDMFLASNSSYSKLLFDENGIIMIADPVKEEKPKQNNFDNIKFDENGYVVSIGNNDNVSNPFHKDYKVNDTKEEKPSNWNIFSKIEFDKDGTVVSAEKMEDKKESMLNKIEFDENGVVISVGNDKLNNTNNFSNEKVETDKSKTVVSESINTNEKLNDKNQKNIQFDENGIVISE